MHFACVSLRHSNQTARAGILLAVWTACATHCASDVFAQPTLTCELSSAAIAPSQSVKVRIFVEDVADVRGYQVSVRADRISGSGTLTPVCPIGAAVDTSRSDFLFFGMETINLLPTCSNCGVIATSCADRRVAVARANGTVSSGGSRSYLATFTLQASALAAPGSTFAVSLEPSPATVIADSGNDEIPAIFGPSCVVTIANSLPLGIPALTAWGAVTLTLLLLIAATMVMSRPSLTPPHPVVAKPRFPARLTALALLMSLAIVTGANADELAVSSVCLNNADCGDGLICTFDRCIGGSCQHLETPHADIAGEAGCGPDGVVDRFDVFAMRDAFAGTFSSPCVEQNLDIWSNNACVPDGNIDLFDILGVLKTFVGRSKCGCSTVADSIDEGPPEGPEPGAPCGCKTCEQTEPGVVLFSGEFRLCAPDLQIKGRGIDFVWARKYRSKIGPSTAMGHGWDFSYNIRVQASGSNLILHNGHGRRDLYLRQPDGTWARREFFRVIEQNPDSSYTVLFADRATWELHPLNGSAIQGKIRRIADRNGNDLTFDYDGLGRLVTIHDSLDTAAHNRDIDITYDAAGLISAVTDFLGRTVTYQYYNGIEAGGGLGDLKSVTTPTVVFTPGFPIPPGHEFPTGKTTTYTYTRGFGDDRLNHNLLSITDAKGQTCMTNTYHATDDPHLIEFDRVVRQTLGGSADAINFTYLDQDPQPANYFASRKVIHNDRMGNITETYFDAENRTVLMREFTGRADPAQPTTETTNRPTSPLRPDDPTFFETRQEYNADSLRTRLVKHNGNEEQWAYDETNGQRRSQGNLLQHCRLPGPLGGDQPQICESFEYDDGMGGCCGTNFVTRHVDGRGYETLNTYDGNGNRTQTQHRISSIVEDWEYNGFGQLTAHVLPENGSGYRRRDEFTYYASGVQYGYLAQELTDVLTLTLTHSFEYNAVGHRIREIDARGHDTQYIYNQLGQVVRERSREVVDASGIRYDRDTFYDANDNVVRIDQQDINHHGILGSNTHFSTLFEYDCLDNMTRMCREIGHVNLSPSDRGCQQPSGQFITNEYTYDANRNLATIRYGEAVNGNQPLNTATVVYDERNLVFREIQAPGSAIQSTTQHDYDGNRNQKAERAGLESSPRLTSYVYDGYDRMIRTTDPMGNVTFETYDANGNKASVRVEGELTDVTGSAANIRLSETDFSYDPMDRLIQKDVTFFAPATQAPIGDGVATTITEYTGTSKIRRVIDDNGNATETTFDTANRESIVQDAKLNTRTYAYDANSNVITLTEADKSDLGNPDQVFVTTSTYDNLDRLVSTLDGSGNLQIHAYDSRDNRARSVDPLGRETIYEYDGVDRLVVTTRDLDGDGADGDGLDIVTYQVWDDSLRLQAQIDGNGNATQYAYDAQDRLIVTQMGDGTIHQVGTGAVWALGAVEPDLIAFVSGYDVHDNKTRLLDANGSTTFAVYDALNRVSTRSIVRGPGVSGTTAEAYFYDGLSRLIRVDDDDSMVTRVHDSMDNVVSDALTFLPGGSPATVTAVYDGAGNRVSCTYPGGRSLSTTYDELDRPSLITDAGATIASYSYVGPDRVERRETPATRTQYLYDGISGVPNPAGDFGFKNVIRTTHTRIATGTILDDRTYRWDRTDNKTIRRDERIGGPRLTHTYAYDAADRMTRATVTNSASVVVRDTIYSMDTVGNRTSVVGPPNPGGYTLDPTLPEPADYYVNQYTTTSFDSREYDANGNLTRGFVGLPSVRSMLYDYRNQMVQLTASGVTYSYAYDALGRRIQTTTNAGGPPTVVRYYSLGKQELEERDAGGTVLATYVYGNYIDDVINMRRGAVNYFYHADDLHNVMAVTSGVGIVVERYEYQDYGQPEFFTGGGAPIGASAIGNPLLFTGRRYDQATGWYYFRSRYLDPLAGRFTTRDPIGIWGDAQSMGNGYTYAGSNPWSAVDPEGQGWLKRLRKSIKRIFEKPVKAVRKFTKQVGRIIKSVARLDAMLFGLKMIILDHLNGARHPARWNYGNHCGLTRKGFQPPKDEVDACCRDHDQCGHWSILTLGTVGSRRCNKNFCDCLREAHCYGNDKCRQYRKDARHLFCLWP